MNNYYNQLNNPLNRHTCRICLDDDLADNMIYPCKCKGTAKYVHKHCLNEWRTTTTNRENFYRCEMCHYRYSNNNNNEPIIENSCTKFIRFISNEFLIFYIFYSLLIFGFGQFLLAIDSKKVVFETITNTNSTESDFVKPFYYLFSGFDIFLLQIILIGYWFYKAINKKLYCKLYNNSKKLILNSIFIMIVSGFLFGWLIAILILELISLRLFQIHFISIDSLHKLNTTFIENYIEENNMENNIVNIEPDNLNPSDNLTNINSKTDENETIEEKNNEV
jgi:hypothetical protein